MSSVTAKLIARVAPLLLAAAIAGCGSSSNGVANDTGAEILHASRTAAERARSVDLTSHSTQGRLTASVDAQLTDQGSRGTISILGVQLELIRRGSTLYVKSRPAVYRRLGITKPVPAGSWVALPAETAASLASEIYLPSAVKRLLSTGGRVTKGRTTSIDGQPVIEVKMAGRLYTATLYVRTTGEPYPVKLEKRGSESGLATFTDWNETAAPVAPAAAITP